jgi:hypothetical protein
LWTLKVLLENINACSKNIHGYAVKTYLEVLEDPVEAKSTI